MRLGKKKSAKADDSGKAKSSDKAASNKAASTTAAKKSDDTEKKSASAGVVATLTDPRTARRALAVARIAGPAVAPFALKAATNVREYLDNRRADKLGVTAEDVAHYRGPTGPVSARIDGLQTSVEELRRRRTTDLQATRFAEVATSRLADLRIAIRAAATMPSGRRRATVHAVEKDLNQIDADLMTFLVGSAG